MQKICCNGKIVDASQPVLPATDRSYRYGDGFFETIRVANGKIPLYPYHKLRIEKTIALLNYVLPAMATVDILFEKTLEVCAYNHCSDAARVRLSFSNGEGGLFEENKSLKYIIEALPLEPNKFFFHEPGVTTGIFNLLKKNCNPYSVIKSASALLYRIAATFATQKNWNDAIILNDKDNICETSIANIFWVKGHTIFTPPLTEGCVGGVMRAYLIEQVNTVMEKPCTEQELLQANEVFLTNALRGIRSVQSINEKHFPNTVAKELWNQYMDRLA